MTCLHSSLRLAIQLLHLLDALLVVLELGLLLRLLREGRVRLEARQGLQVLLTRAEQWIRLRDTGNNLHALSILQARMVLNEGNVPSCCCSLALTSYIRSMGTNSMSGPCRGSPTILQQLTMFIGCDTHVCVVGIRYSQARYALPALSSAATPGPPLSPGLTLVHVGCPFGCSSAITAIAVQW